jgi:hypothetical protein
MRGPNIERVDVLFRRGVGYSLADSAMDRELGFDKSGVGESACAKHAERLASAKVPADVVLDASDEQWARAGWGFLWPHCWCRSKTIVST